MKYQRYTLGSEPHSFVKLSFSRRKQRLFRVVTLKNIEANFIFLARL